MHPKLYSLFRAPYPWIQAPWNAFDNPSRGITCLLMDRSGSMERFGDVPLRAMREHVRKLSDLGSHQCPDVIINVFDMAMDSLVPMTRAWPSPPRIPSFPTGGGSRIHGSVLDTLSSLIDMFLCFQERGRIRPVSLVVFTDGEDTSDPPGKYLEKLHSLTEYAVAAGFQLIAVGIGRDGRTLAEELGFPPYLAMTVHPTGLDILKSANAMTHSVVERITERPRTNVKPIGRAVKRHD